MLAEERALSELSEKKRSLLPLDDDNLRHCSGNTAKTSKPIGGKRERMSVSTSLAASYN